MNFGAPAIITRDSGTELSVCDDAHGYVFDVGDLSKAALGIVSRKGVAEKPPGTDLGRGKLPVGTRVRKRGPYREQDSHIIGAGVCDDTTDKFYEQECYLLRPADATREPFLYPVQCVHDELKVIQEVEVSALTILAERDGRTTAAQVRFLVDDPGFVFGDTHSTIWYPDRCEFQGCQRKSNLRTCPTCNMVKYCSEGHRSSDILMHREDCVVFQRLGLRARFYADEVVLQRYPLMSRAECSQNKPRPQQLTRCFLCGRAARQDEIRLTDCCSMPICQVPSITAFGLAGHPKQLCNYLHECNSSCGLHGTKATCLRDRDWRDCPTCLDAGGDYDDCVSAFLWRGLNGYNFYPLRSEHVPRHSLCQRCPKCYRKFISGVEGASHVGKTIRCLNCSDDKPTTTSS